MALIDDLKEYYRNLLILQYKGKERAEATIDLNVEEALVDFLPITVRDSFNLDTAVGAQLDVIGKYANTKRTGQTFTKSITLSDDEYRELIRIAIVKNRSFSSLFEIENLLIEFFGDTILVFDFQNMSMGYYFDAEIGSRDLAELFIVNGLLPKPMGVQLASVIYSANVDSFFGFISYEFPVASKRTGFNTYEDYNEDWPWLDYANAINI